MEWKRGHVIGHGSTATVSVATSAISGEIFAVKSAELSQSEPLQREAKILSSLNSPHVVSYIGNDITRERNDNKLTYNLLIEYVPGGALSDAVSARKGLGEPTIRRYARKIVQGLDYLHSLGVVHCDIKGRNVLLARDGPKIADFGCAKAAGSPAKAVAGTPMFMAPEAARGDHQGPASDIWSLGCTIIEMSGFSPWPNCGGDHVSVLYRVAYSEDLPQFPGFLSEEARDFLGKCLRRRPEERWTAGRLLKHPFLAASVSKFDSNDYSSSPTSILEFCCRDWSSVGEEGSEASLSGSRDRDSATERIGRLATDAAEVAWSLDGQGWSTIRGGSCSAYGDNKEVNWDLVNVDYDYGGSRSSDHDLDYVCSTCSESNFCEADIVGADSHCCCGEKNLGLSSLVVLVERERNMSIFPLISRVSNL